MTTAKVRKWGDSLGVILPKELTREEKLAEGDTVILHVEKEADLTPFFGACKGREESTQKFKNEMRKIWSY